MQELGALTLLAHNGAFGIEVRSPETRRLLRLWDMGDRTELHVIDETSGPPVVKATVTLGLEATGLLDQALGILAQRRDALGDERRREDGE